MNSCPFTLQTPGVLFARFAIGITLVVACCATHAQLAAESDTPEMVLTWDSVVVDPQALRFPELEKRGFGHGPFIIHHAAFLSGPHGERWAMVTLHNKTMSAQTIMPRHVLGVFANGEAKEPEAVGASEAIPPNTSITLALDFGVHAFPLAKLVASK